MKYHSLIRYGLVCATSLFGLSGAALAQQADGADAAQQIGLGDIIVTAQKRAERLQDVPISVSALDSSRLEQLNASDLSGLASAMPGVHIGTFGNQPFSATFNIRGVGVVEPDAYAGNSVSIVLDGVPQFFNYGAIIDMFDVERVEVLKGPQGTLFGANTTGGVVNIVNQRPEETFGGYVVGTMGTLEEKHLRASLGAAVNVPLAEGLSARFTGFRYKRDGWVKNVMDRDENLGEQEKTILRGQLRYRHDNIDINLLGEINQIRGTGTYVAQGAAPGEYWYVAPGTADAGNPSIQQPYNVCGGLATHACSAGDAVVARDPTLPNIAKLNSYRSVLTVDVSDTALGDITYIAGWKKYNWLEYLDTDGTILPLNRGRNYSFGYQLTQELRSAFNLGNAIHGVAGVYYMKNHYETARQGQSGGAGYMEQTSQDQHNYSVSGFGNLYWDVTDQLQLLGGIRYSHERTKMRAGQFLSQNNSGLGVYPYCGTNCNNADQTRPPGTVDIGGVGFVSGRKSWDDVAWKAGVNYKPNDDVLAYGSVSRGFKSGGFTGRVGRASDLGPFAPEYVTTYEVGVKAEWLDRRLRTNFALFHSCPPSAPMAQI